MGLVPYLSARCQTMGIRSLIFRSAFAKLFALFLKRASVIDSNALSDEPTSRNRRPANEFSALTQSLPSLDLKFLPIGET